MLHTEDCKSSSNVICMKYPSFDLELLGDKEGLTDLCLTEQDIGFLQAFGIQGTTKALSCHIFSLTEAL